MEILASNYGWELLFRLITAPACALFVLLGTIPCVIGSARGENGKTATRIGLASVALGIAFGVAFFTI